MKQAMLASALILMYVLITQYGRRKFSWHTWLPPLLGIPAIGVIYLRTAPMTQADLVLDALGIGAGTVFGLLAARSTRLERDARTLRIYTRCGIAFVVTWIVALGSRVAFVWGLEDDAAFRKTVGTFMQNHHIGRDAIAPAFVLIALTMFSIRLAALAVKIRQLPAKVADQPAEAVHASQGGRRAPIGRPESGRTDALDSTDVTTALRH
jgi:hypothetical protein